MVMEKNNQIKNIIIVYDYSFINGGAGKVAIQSAIELSKKNYNVYFFSAVGPVCRELEKSSVNVTCMNIKDINNDSKYRALFKGIWNFKAYGEFGDFLKKFNNKDTVIHFHGWTKALSSSVVKKATDNNFTVIVTLHDYFSFCPNGGLYNYKSGEICNIKPSSIRCYFCNCDKRSYFQKIWRAIRQIVQNKYVKNNSKIKYIYISDLNKKVSINQLKSEDFYFIQNPIEVDKNVENKREFDFIYVGRVSEEKGVDLLCEAIDRLNKKGYKYKVLIVGDGPLLNELEEQYRNIEFCGWNKNDEVYSLIAKSKYLVFPSKWYEGAPLTIIEAMLLNTPCIISDCTSAVEIIQNNVNGLIFETSNIDSLCEQLINAMSSDKYNKFKSNIRGNMNKDRFLLCNHANNLEKLYNQLIK